MKLARTILIGGFTPTSLVADVGFTGLRVFMGLALALAHGWGKMPPPEQLIGYVTEMGFPAPTLFAWAAALSEFGGGLLLAAGLLTRPAAFLILCTMLTAAFVAHGSDPFSATGPGEPAKEMALLYAAIAFAFMLAGSGRISADGVIRR